MCRRFSAVFIKTGMNHKKISACALYSCYVHFFWRLRCLFLADVKVMDTVSVYGHLQSLKQLELDFFAMQMMIPFNTKYV
jgi:hypothetical protein